MTAATLPEHTAWVQSKPDYYTACRFLGRGKYDRQEHATLSAAIAAAKTMHVDRPVMVYAVRSDRDSLVQLVTP